MMDFQTLMAVAAPEGLGLGFIDGRRILGQIPSSLLVFQGFRRFRA